MTHVELNHSRYIGHSAVLRFVPPDDQRRLSKSIPLLLVLGKLPVPGGPTIWITEGQGPTAGVLCCVGVQINIQTFRVEFFRSLVDHFRILRSSFIGIYALPYCLLHCVSPSDFDVSITYQDQ